MHISIRTCIYAYDCRCYIFVPYPFRRLHSHSFPHSTNVFRFSSFLLRFSSFGGARKGAPSRFATSKVKHSSREVGLTELFVNCVSNTHDLGPFVVLFSTTALINIKEVFGVHVE